MTFGCVIEDSKFHPKKSNVTTIVTVTSETSLFSVTVTTFERAEAVTRYSLLRYKTLILTLLQEGMGLS